LPGFLAAVFGFFFLGETSSSSRTGAAFVFLLLEVPDDSPAQETK
jgi:hypothetical protein